MFRRKYNTFLLETLLPEDEGIQDGNTHYHRIFESELTNNLSTISALYIYTGTPPHGYGSQAPKVAETVNRSLEYNRKTITAKTINIGGVDVERLQWEKKDGKFPHDKVHGNYITSVMKDMCIQFVSNHHTQIDTVVDRIMDKVLNQSSDILTQGRQTFCPFREQSVTAAQAYEMAFDFLSTNTGRDCFSLLDWIQAILECFDKDSLKIVKSVEVVEEVKILDPETKQREIRKKITTKLKKVNIDGNQNVRKEMKRLVCSFASYIKHKERGKKDRRAIASATMLLRPFLHIIESFHLELSKDLPGSTISIGGEEKKAKITSNMEITSLDTDLATHVSQGTEDATKWNECLSPSIFYLMHHYFFDKSIRGKIPCKYPSNLGQIFCLICKFGHLFQAWKMIQIGPGPIVNNNSHYCRIQWIDEHQKSMNERTSEWYEKLKDKITEDRRYFMSSPGMLMGMLNAASTTVGLLPMNFNMQRNKMKVVCMRSSDDSTTKYLSDSAENNMKCVVQNKQNLSLIGINLSPDKTFFLPEGIAEYTSWYIDGKFVSQYGTEVPSIRPQGKTPYDDLYAIAKGTSTLLQTLVINHLGATARLRIGVAACKRLWRVKELNSNIRENVSLKVQLIEDGGENLWNCANCHLNEIAMKRRLAATTEEIDYLYKITNPDNPFCDSVNEEMSYSKEHGCLVISEVETPNCVFRYCKRSNRSFKGKEKKSQADKEKACAAVFNLLNLVDPTISLEFPSASISIQTHVQSLMTTMRDRIELNESDSSLVERALSVLTTCKREEADEQSEFWDGEEQD